MFEKIEKVISFKNKKLCETIRFLPKKMCPFCKGFISLILLFLFLNYYGFAANENSAQNLGNIDVEFPTIIIKGIEAEIKIKIENTDLIQRIKSNSTKIFINNIEFQNPPFENGFFSIKHKFIDEQISIKIENFSFSQTVHPIELWLSVLPPLIAIIIALLFKEVFTALFIGIFVGTSIIYYHAEQSIFLAIFKGIFAIIDTYILESLNDSGHLSIIVFSLLIAGMVNIITKNGGMKGVVDILSKYANSPRSGQFVTWLLGIAIFFDDYANTLVVGNTMRQVSDKLKISREKLSYIVDSTAAPIAAIAFVTTWIGAELGYIEDGISKIGISEGAYNVFFNSLAYSFYPILALIFIPILIFKKKDFGPMLHAEKKARQAEVIASSPESDSQTFGDFEISVKAKARWYNAVIPVLIVIFGTFIGLIYSGWNAEIWNNEAIGFSTKLSEIIGGSDSYSALLWSSLLGVLVAAFLSTTQKILNIKEVTESLLNGFKTMMTAIVILVLAWSLALVTEHLHTADFISSSLIYINLSPYFVPTFTFIMAALISFSTGSSWGTMAILYPLILPTSWLISVEYGLDYDTSILIFYNVVSCVLAGSVLGDHCSPISDTTILSSLASSCNHIDHVKTQLPYALTVGGVSLIFGTIPSAFGFSSLIIFPLSIIVLYLIVHFFGRQTEI
ncbi:MAG: Na+/H+ antiporter NhaC family protein [Bacteroidetes bacterium]|jgi:Na+/H+ antiporter NhaC|nr:Na+/H+ antiporter NhaC family protein [Bacteroidota bacterium]MBT6685898.1 Na+/H+ antiporter NhaC family protein [Bacteroidota bacterium]